MIACVLDTNAAIALLNGRPARVKERLFAQPPGSVALSAIVVHELYWGAFRSGRVAYNLENVRVLAEYLPTLDFDARDALAAGELRAALALRGAPIGPYDTLIAGQAKARGLTVVTNNTREFNRIPDLKVEDWSV